MTRSYWPVPLTRSSSTFCRAVSSSAYSMLTVMPSFFSKARSSSVFSVPEAPNKFAHAKPGAKATTLTSVCATAVVVMTMAAANPTRALSHRSVEHWFPPFNPTATKPSSGAQSRRSRLRQASRQGLGQQLAAASPATEHSTGAISSDRPMGLFPECREVTSGPDKSSAALAISLSSRAL